MPIRLLTIAAALTLPAAAQTTPAAPAPSATLPARESFQLNIARNDREVVVTWVLPQVEIKQFEIFRNTRPEATGRGRVAAVRTEPPVYYDSVPDSASAYWYWLKITLSGGHVLNIGPVATPDSKVWTP